MSAELLSTLQSGPDTGPPLPTGTGAVIGEQAETPRIPDVLSILPLRGFVILPGTVAPLNVRRPASIKLLDETLPQSKVIGLVAQRDESKEEPEPQEHPAPLPGKGHSPSSSLLRGLTFALMCGSPLGLS